MKTRVLLVDDEEPFLEITKFFLERERDIVVDTAVTVRTALDKLSTGEYNAVISDFQMPDMDGIEFLKIMRAQGRDIVFILLTGRGREDVAIQALNNGADFYLQKGGDAKVQFAELANMLEIGVGRRSAERDVRDRERFLANMFASIQDGISVLSPDMTIMQVNPAMERWYQHAMPLVGKKCFVAYQGRDSPCEACPALETIDKKAYAHRIVPFRGEKAEQVGWLDLYTFPMLDDSSGELRGIIEYVRDATDRTRAELSLKESEEKYRELVDRLTSIVMRVDKDGRMRFLNKFGLRFFGYDEEEIIGKPIIGTIMPSDEVPQALITDFAQGILSDPGKEYSHDQECVCKDGRRVCVSWTGKAVLSPSGSVDEILSVGNDITAQKRQNDYLVQANRKMNLLGHLTRHDALNQLSVLVGWLDIASDSETNEKAGRHLAKVRESAESIIALLEFTGEYERMGSSNPEWIDAKKAMREGTQGLPLEGIELDCGIEGVEILSDSMLPRVFGNLIDNSIRHGQKVSRISCRYNIEGSNLVLVYEDDGVGLSDASRARVFERGMGIHTGYGLFMVREILGMTGITISETGSAGKGVRFEIRVPKGGYRLKPKDNR